ncbi:MAG: hypothetical protein R3D44_01185 [Hyphomicrobiaceae bacterium]
MPTGRALSAVAAALLAALTAAEASVADQLPAEACAAVAGEHAKLVAAGLPDMVKKGPEWAKANLQAGQIKDVARFIKLQEELLFRCGYDKRRTLPGEEGDEAGDVKASDGGPPLPRRKPASMRDVGAAAAAHPAKAQSAKGGALLPTTKPKTKPKAKVDDAYRPPPKSTAPQQ